MEKNNILKIILIILIVILIIVIYFYSTKKEFLIENGHLTILSSVTNIEL